MVPTGKRARKQAGVHDLLRVPRTDTGSYRVRIKLPGYSRNLALFTDD
jgi:hypothetical protein